MISPQQPLLQSLSKLIAFQTIVSLSFLVGCSNNPNATSSQPTAETPAVAQAPALRSPDVVYVPTPQAVVDRMLEIANVNSKDVLYDLGSGVNFIRSAHPDRVENLTDLDRWLDVVGDRPAVKKGLKVLNL